MLWKFYKSLKKFLIIFNEKNENTIKGIIIFILILLSKEF